MLDKENSWNKISTVILKADEETVGYIKKKNENNIKIKLF